MVGENDIQSNVVLTADVSGYEQSMAEASVSTNRVITAVDKLAGQINSLTKTAGKISLGIGVAQLGTITAATAAWASYEKQISRLNAQAAIQNRSTADASKQMKVYSQTVKDLRTNFGETTASAAELTRTLSKLTDGTQSMGKLADTFQKMSNATGESASGLAQSVLGLQRVMGTNQSEVGKYADQLTTLASGANTTASALADFSAQIAPIGRLIGQSQTDITGISTAFIRAGQDGQQAATVYSKFVSDIAYATQSGSPDLAKYANLVGLTVSQFKELSGTEQVTRFLESINRQGPAAITTLNRMGLDGARTVRAISAVTQQSGGIRTAIEQARASMGDGSVSRGSRASMEGLSDEWGRLSENMKRGWEEMGEVGGVTLSKLLKPLTELTELFADIMEGPFGKFVSVLTTIGGSVAATTGALLLMAGAVMKVSAAFLAMRSTASYGLREGFRGGGAISQTAPGVYGTTGSFLGMRGRQVAEVAGERPGLRMMYNAGQLGGSYVRNIANAVGMGATGARAGVFGLMGRDVPEGGSRFGSGSGPGGLLNRLAGMTGAGIQTFLTPQLDQMRYGNPADRMKFWQRTMPDLDRATMRGLVGEGNKVRAADERYDAAAQERQRTKNDPTATQAERNRAANAEQVAKAQLAAARRSEAAMIQQAAAAASSARATTANTAATNAQVNGYARLGTAMTAFTARVGSAAIGGVASFGKGAGAALGLTGMGPGGAAVGAGMLALMLGPLIKDMLSDKTEYTARDMSSSNEGYYQAAGINRSLSSGYTLGGQRSQMMTLSQANKVASGDVQQARSKNYEPTNGDLSGLTAGQAAAFLSDTFLSIQDSPEAVNAMKLDLLNQLGTGEGRKAWEMLQTGTIPGQTNLGTGSRMVRRGKDPHGNWRDFFSPGGGSAGVRMDMTSGRTTDEQLGTLLSGAGRADTKKGASASFSAALGYGLNEAAVSSDFNRTRATMAGQIAQVFDVDWENQDAKEAAAKQFEKEFGYNPLTEPTRKVRTEGWRKASPAAEKSAARQAKAAGVDMNAFKGLSEDVTRMGPARAKSLLVSLGMAQEDVDRLEDSPTQIQNALVKVMIGGGGEKTETIEKRLSRMVGGGALGSTRVQASIASPDNATLLALGGADLLRGIGGSDQERVRRLNAIMNQVGDSGDQNYLLAQQALAQRKTAFGFQAPFMTGAQQISHQATTLRGQIGAYNPTSQNPEQLAQIQAEAGELMQSMTQQAQTFFSLLQQNTQLQRSVSDFDLQVSRSAEQYHRSRERAEEDFNTQRRWAEADFNLQRRWGLADYHLQRDRGERDYELGRRRSENDFRLQQMRNQKDFHHQVDLMVEQNAKNYYNIYQRAQVQNTSSAQWLVGNTADQTKRLKEQTSNLSALREMGLSKDAIQQLDLTNPQNAQQLARMVAELQSNPALVKQLNKTITERLAAAGALTKDASSKEWEEYVYQFNLATTRASNDFNKSMKRSQEDFDKQMARTDKDFKKQMARSWEQFDTQMERQGEQFDIQMDRNAEDYGIAMAQMRKDFSTQMDRAREDMDTLARGMSDGMLTILTKASETLGGESQKQAKQILKTFRQFKSDIGGSSDDIMLLLADIFGFKYKPKSNPHGAGKAPAHVAAPAPIGRRADGGTLPGYSPGKDNLHYVDKHGNELHLSGGEAIMVPEWTQQQGGPAAVKRMNDEARAGRRSNSFWMGGVMPLKGADVSRHTSGYPNAIWSGDLNYPGRSDYGKPVGAFKSGTVAQMNYIGDRSYGRWAVLNHDGGQSSLYAHLSGFGGIKVGQRVGAGRTIGYVGDIGNTTGPHLHFEIKGGHVDFGDKSVGIGGGGATLKEFLDSQRFKRILKQVSKRQQKVDFMGGFPDGFWPEDIKKRTRSVWKELEKRYTPEISLSNVSDAPSPQSANQRIVRRAMERAGWGSSQWDPLYALVMQESGFRNTAQNPTSTAYGMFQFLNSTWAGVGGHKTSDPGLQALYGMRYIKSRYGSPAKAWDFHRAHNWYGEGSIFTGPQTIGVGERGAEAVFPLNEKGADMLHNLIERYSASGSDAKGARLPAGVPVTVYNQQQYHYDQSTKFTGDITVQANNPAELQQQLMQRQRVMALNQPVLAGR